MLETIKKALAEGKVTAWWEINQFKTATNSYEDSIFVQIGKFSENHWYRFFREDIDDLPAEIVDMADKNEFRDYLPF